MTVRLDGLQCPHCGEPYLKPGERPCACGCPLPARPGGSFATDACRTRYWKATTGYVHPDTRAARNARNGTQTTLLQPSRPGGCQLSLAKTRRVLLDRLAGLLPDAEQVIDDALLAALPDRQRSRARARVGTRHV